MMLVHLGLLGLRGRHRHRDVADHALHQDELEPDGYRAKPHEFAQARVWHVQRERLRTIGQPAVLTISRISQGEVATRSWKHASYNISPSASGY